MYNVGVAKEHNLPQLFDWKLEIKKGVFPSTRYQGSKSKIVQWIDFYTKHLEFDSVLDAFGGTGCVGYMFKQNGKKVFYNDLLKSNYQNSLALIKNPATILSQKDIDFVLKKQKNKPYPTFIQDTFSDIYFTDKENEWLDIAVANIHQIDDIYKQSLSYYALFQSCIIKRPYNLFHRKNLYIRTSDIKRTFGNKKTWDTSFEEHFRKFAKEANYAVFDNGKEQQVFNSNIFDLEITSPDLVYIDPPYISGNGIGVDYYDFYHFLEGIIDYDQWADLIDTKSKHKKIKTNKNDWCDKSKIHQAFDRLFNKFKNSILVISYRDDGIPTIEELISILKKYKNKIEIKSINYKYVLSKNSSKEILIITN